MYTQSAHVLMNLSNKSEKKIRCNPLPKIVLVFPNNNSIIQVIILEWDFKIIFII